MVQQNLSNGAVLSDWPMIEKLLKPLDPRTPALSCQPAAADVACLAFVALCGRLCVHAERGVLNRGQLLQLLRSFRLSRPVPLISASEEQWLPVLARMFAACGLRW